MNKTKICIKCNVEKSVDEFHADRRRPDNLFPYCKRCRTKNKKLYDEIKIYDNTDMRRCSTCKSWKHIDEFYTNPTTKSGIHHHCKACSIIQSKNYYDKHWKELNKKNYWKSPEENRKRFRKYYRENIEEMRERSRNYYKYNKDIVRKQRKKWMNTKGRLWYEAYRKSAHGKFVINRNAHRRRERIKINGDDNNCLTLSEWEEIISRQNNKCLSCKKQFSDKLPPTMDHIIPVVKGGTLNKNNVQGLCKSCNSKKGAKTVDYRPYWIYR